MLKQILTLHSIAVLIFLGGCKAKINTSGGSGSGSTPATSNNPSVEFSVASATIAENAGSATVNVTLSSTATATITVAYAVGGTATAGSDFTFSSGVLQFLQGDLTKTLTIPITNDALAESSETIILTIGTVVNATAGNISTYTLTITDNDTTPTVNFSSSAQSLAESAGTITLTASLDQAGAANITVPFVVSGTASGGGADHNCADSNITITAGNTTGTYTCTITNDALDENNETVIFTMGTPTNATAGTTTAHTVTITDNDSAPTVTFSSASQSVAESVGTATFTATLSGASGLDVTVPYTLTGTATGAGTDYSITASPVTISAGSTTATITITVIDDTLDETDETVIATMGSPTNATQGATTVHTATISDDDATPTVSFSANSQSIAENGGTITVTAALSAASALDVTVPFVLTGTATDSGTDYTASASPITILAGATSATASFIIVDDTLDENNETAIVTMGSPTNASQGAITVHTITITDNDNPPTVTFSSASQTAAESAGTASFTANLSTASGLDVTVPFSLSGTATSGGVDYSITASPLTISAGSTSATITFTIIDDATNESSETAIVTMGAPTNASQGATTVHTATITDNDSATTVDFTAASQTIGENAGTVTVSLTLASVAGQDVSVPYTISGTSTAGGTDHNCADGTATITAGNTTTNITCTTLVDDALDEANETIIFTMGSPTNATAGSTTVHTVTITDNDAAPTVDFTAASQSGAEDTVGTMTITAQLDAASGQTVTVPFTLSGTATGGGTDYSITASPITITAGNTTGTATITVATDTLDENNETVIVTMGSPTNATAGTVTVHTATITDDDAAPSVTFSAASQSVSEGVGTATITANLSTASGLDVTLPYTMSGTATGAGTDYSITASPITITAGNTSGTITITVTDDSLDEVDETIIVTMGAPTNASQGATTVHTATITDNDSAPTIYFTAASQSVAESAGTISVGVSISAASGQTISVPYTISGTSTAGGTDHNCADGTATITAGNTSTTVSCTTLVDDALDEDDETVIFTMGAPTNATSGATTVHTVTITDNDASPSVQWTAASQSGAENVGTMTITAQLSAASGRAVSIPYTLTGTATGAGTDYSITASPVSIAAGSTTTTVTITVADDSLDESDETVIATIGSPTNATAGATTVHTATITDNDNAPTVTFSAASQSAAENAGTATVTFNLSAASSLDVTVPYTLSGTATGSGTDYSVTASPITITAGSTSGTATVTITDDTLDEVDETVILTMGAPTNASQGATTVHTVTITDNDAAPSVDFSASSQTVAESAGTATVTANLSAVSGKDITVAYTVTGTATNGGTDHDLADGTISITAGNTSGTKTINITEDTMDESNETIILTMGACTNCTAGSTYVHTVTITDNDPLPIADFSTDTEIVAETVGTVTVTINIDRTSAFTVGVPWTLSGTASNPSDHNLGASGTCSITTGNTSCTQSITIVNDVIPESTETIILTMGTVTNGSAGSTYPVQTISITDADLKWTKVGGGTAVNQSGVYGVVNTGAGTNIPGSRMGAGYTVKDSNGNAWMFGGYGYDSTGTLGYLCDLWKYDGTNWIHAAYDQTTADVCDDVNRYTDNINVTVQRRRPGGRRDSVLLVDSNGNIWVHGGYGADNVNPATTYGYRADFWKYTTNWTKNGSLPNNVLGVYGVLGTEAGTNKAGSRTEHAGWADASGNFWVFGGYGYDSASGPVYLNDLFKYNTTTANWTWMAGSSTGNASGVYSGAVVPGARKGAAYWKQGTDFYLFGGYGYDSAGTLGYLSDIWKWDGAAWSFIGGNQTANAVGVYGTRGTAAGANWPGGRLGAAVTYDSSAVWLFGGNGYDKDSGPAAMNDLWKYSAGQWTWWDGSNDSGALSDYTNADPDLKGPGARYNMGIYYNSSDTTFRIFGGYGNDTSTAGYLNDFWKFGP